MTKCISSPVKTRVLAKPVANCSIDVSTRQLVNELCADNGRCRQFFIDGVVKVNVGRFQVALGSVEFHINGAKGRTGIPRDK